MERIKRKLLQGTLRFYFMFAAITVLAAAPAFYFITQWLYLNDTNETLMITKRNFLSYSLPRLKIADIPSFNGMNWNIKIEPGDKNITKDIFTIRPILDSLENENENYRVLLSPVKVENHPYTLMVRMNMIESENLVESIAIVFVGLIILLITGLYFITQKISRKLWEPFYHSLAQIERFEVDKNFLPQWQDTNTEEFIRLNSAVNALIERNVAIFKTQKEFVENAAHELQTPLAAFQAKLDSLMQIPGISSNQAKLISDLYDAATRLNRLNKNLLLLSKLDRDWFASEDEFDAGNMLNKQVVFFTEQAETKSIAISCTEPDHLTLKANIVLFESLLNNLLLNAIRHNHLNGVIVVSLQNNKLIICNSGSKIPLDTAKIFERFSKTDPSYSGTGLGLAIVKKIADLYSWKISYSWKNSLHTFQVEFNTNLSTKY